MIPLRAFLIVKNSRADVELARTSPQTGALNINLTTKAQKSNERPQGEPSKYR